MTTTDTYTPAPKRSRLPLILGVTTGLLAATTLGAGAYAYTTKQGLTETQATLTATQTDLANTQTQLTAARADAASWEDVSEKWRLCGVAALEISITLLDGGIFAAGLPIGTASAKCEDARTADDAMGMGAL